MSTEFHFPIFVAVSLIAFLGVLRFALRRRPTPPPWTRTVVVAAVVVVGGMVFAKAGAKSGLSWVVYYGVPASLTLLLPPIAFRMRRLEVVQYLVMAWCTSPIIHVAFSFLLGWKEYMPFLPVPAWWESGRIAVTAVVVLAAAAVAVMLVGYLQRTRRNPNDRDVLEYLRRSGSDLTKPHLVQFFLHFPSRTAALRVADAIELEGFKTGVGPGPATAYHILLACREMVPVESELVAIRERFDALARELGGTYEQWDAPVVPLARSN